MLHKQQEHIFGGNIQHMQRGRRMSWHFLQCEITGGAFWTKKIRLTNAGFRVLRSKQTNTKQPTMYLIMKVLHGYNIWRSSKYVIE